MIVAIGYWRDKSLVRIGNGKPRPQPGEEFP
jgi:hypothetical protein